jgi:hypothetical protein
MAVRQARYSKDEFARRGDALYESEMSIEWFTVLVREASNNPSPTCSRIFFRGFELGNTRNVSEYHPSAGYSERFEIFPSRYSESFRISP